MAVAGAFSGPDRIAIRAGRAFDGHQPMPGGALVLCADGKIAGVEPAAAPVPDRWPVADFSDGTVLPGLTDCHVHLCGDSGTGALDRLPGYSDDELDRVIETALRAQLAAGVTTVRDLGDRRWAVLAWRDRVAAGTAGFPAPAIVASGPPITTRGGHCCSMGGEADTTAELRAAVRERADRGADIVKVMASGGTMTPGTDVLACQYPPGLLRAVVEEAHTHGLPVTAHAHGLPAVIQAADAGADGIEHCSCLTERGLEQPARLLEQLAANRTAVCPTMGIAAGATPPPAVLAMQQRTGATWGARQAMTGRLHQAGVTLVSGADSGISAGKPHGILALAIADLVTAGIPATAALATATSTAAQACGLGRRKGRLRTGYDADIIVVVGDPLTDISALTHIQTVYLAGHAMPTAREPSAPQRNPAAKAHDGIATST
jgi:imidazolonepropionase-like amidohydrolase